eukprot:12785105-Ditylum_brightwellii.AAC.1
MFYQKPHCTGEHKLPLWPDEIGPDNTLALHTQKDVDMPVGQQVTIQDMVAEKAKEDSTASKGQNDDTQIQTLAMPPS